MVKKMTDYTLSPPHKFDLKKHFIGEIEKKIKEKTPSSSIVSINLDIFQNHPGAKEILRVLAEEYKAIGWSETEDIILEVEDSVKKGQMNSAMRVKLKYPV